MFRKILVPVDLEEPATARKAIDVAKRLGETEGAEVLLFSVMPNPNDAEREAALTAKLEALVAAEKGELKLDGVLNLGGSVPSEVRDAAEDLGCDLVVMASHWPRLDDYLWGSRSAKVALHSTCSVLVVR